MFISVNATSTTSLMSLDAEEFLSTENFCSNVRVNCDTPFDTDVRQQLIKCLLFISVVSSDSISISV